MEPDGLWMWQEVDQPMLVWDWLPFATMEFNGQVTDVIRDVLIWNSGKYRPPAPLGRELEFATITGCTT